MTQTRQLTKIFKALSDNTRIDIFPSRRSRRLNCVPGTLSQPINTIDLGKLGYLTIIIFVVSWIISLGIYRIKHYDELV